MMGAGIRRFWAWPWELRRAGVLGINGRNVDFLLRLNARSSYPCVDDKALTKDICKAQGIPVPDTYGIISRFGDIASFPETIRAHKEFVIKPARGAGGRGILILACLNGTGFRASDGRMRLQEEVQHHLSGILSGLYSLGGHPDKAVLEECIRPHPAFEGIAVNGTPDVRIIVYRGVSVMAMIRLPTRASRGRANLHQGAVGVGVDLDTGETVGGVWRDRAVEVHPDTQVSLRGVGIPYWGDILDAAARLSCATGLGYLGVDVVLDASKGLLVLEANARPGLAVQIANRCGLLNRLAEVDSRLEDAPPPSTPRNCDVDGLKRAISYLSLHGPP